MLYVCVRELITDGCRVSVCIVRRGVVGRCPCMGSVLS